VEIKKKLIALLAIGFCHGVWAQAPGGGGHGGHVGGTSGGDDFACFKAKISHFNPEHLTTVAPGSEFSFTVSGSNGPNHIHVSIRQEPVKIKVEDKDTFYVVKGNLPPELKNETVRISVKAKAKSAKCDAEGGWLLKVSE
jgi:hypothetical protein